MIEAMPKMSLRFIIRPKHSVLVIKCNHHWTSERFWLLSTDAFIIVSMQFVILIECPDQVGIVARFSAILYRFNANVISLEQHVEDGGWFFMRIEAMFDGLLAEQTKLIGSMQRLGSRLVATVEVFKSKEKQRVAILATSDAACPSELLTQEQAGLLAGEIVCVIANKPDLAALAKVYQKPFYHVATEDGMAVAEAEMAKLLTRYQVEVVVLARYMKVLSDAFVRRFENRILNIHHGFLPAFKGNRPYHQAWERGVKCIGATAHFVTADLDDGPIISQEVVPISHQYSVDDLIRAGRDIEKRVLVQAVQAYLTNKIIIHNKRTIIFH